MALHTPVLIGRRHLPAATRPAAPGRLAVWLESRRDPELAPGVHPLVLVLADSGVLVLVFAVLAFLAICHL